MEQGKLFENYGRAMVNLEIAQGKVNELKGMIQQFINQPKPEAPKDDAPKKKEK